MGINKIAEQIHENAKAKGFWDPLATWEDLRKQIEEKILNMTSPEYQKFFIELLDQHEKDFDNYFKLGFIALIMTELGEAVQADRRGDINGFVEEIGADVPMRLFDFCQGLGIDIDKQIHDKSKKIKDRPYLHGKAY